MDKEKQYDRIRELAANAASDSIALESLIGECEGYIFRSLSKITGHFVGKEEDEWAVGLTAFAEAACSYTETKGDFLPFAYLVMKRRLIDYYRKENRRTKAELILPEELEAVPDLQASVSDGLVAEIHEMTRVLDRYGFAFWDLLDVSPRAEKTRKSCALAVMTVLNNPNIFHELQSTKALPIKKMIEITNLPRKILERHRKYIIAAVEILEGDFPYLAEYVRFIREEWKR